MNTQTNNQLVAEIHDAFYSAEDRLLKEAKELLATPNVDPANRAERCKKLGFGSAKPVKTTDAKVSAFYSAKTTISTIEYWRVHYPNNKYLTESEVKRICEKYGLVLGDAGNYLGDIPEKNLQQIEAFELKQEDWIEKPTLTRMESILRQYMGLTSIQPPTYESEFLKSTYEQIASDFFFPRLIPSLLDPMAYFEKPKVQKIVPAKLIEKEKEKPAFKICAPQQDFHTAGYVIKEGYILVYDPVVLQPVKNGYLIVTAWGAEASDEIVVNQNNN